MVRLETRLGVFEGTPEAIARTIALLRDAPDGALEPPRPSVQVQLDAVFDTRPRPALREVPTNERMLHDYAADTGITAGSRKRRVRAVESFERTIAPKSFLDVTPADVSAFDRALLDSCKHERWNVQVGRGTAHHAPHVRCDKAQYAWALAKPAACNPADCALFARQHEGPAARLAAVRDFYAFLKARGLVATNPAEDVCAKRQKAVKRRGRGKRKYAPSTSDVVTILRAVQERGTPRDVALILLLFKWGRRPSHIVLLDAADVFGVLQEGVAFADFTDARERLEALNKDGRTKLAENLIAPIDEETRRYLADVYFPYRQATWGYAWNEGPLFPSSTSGDRLDKQQVQYVLDCALEHLAATAATDREHAEWAEHADPRSKRRISAGCARHYLTTTLEEFGIDREKRMTIRGDVLGEALEAYRHLTPEKVVAMYRMPNLLPCEPYP